MSIHMATDGAPFPSVEDDLRRQIMGLRASLASAEAEVARLKAPLEPKRPYEPKVGDVVGYLADCVDGGDSRVVTGIEGGYARIWYTKSESWARLPVCDVTFIRPATPAERAAAGLPAEPPEPAEAHAAPQALPEHLALLEASAAYWSTHGMDEEKWERMIQAGKDLLAAIARRDGGGK